MKLRFFTKLFGSRFGASEIHQHNEESKSMSSPIIEPGKPIVLELEPGTYYRCTCGGSSNMPFCDGSCAK